MIIVRMMGGLGNQMFQYAFYRNLSAVHKNVKMDIISHYSLHEAHNGYELENVFSLSGNYASIKEIEKLSCYKDLRVRILISKFKKTIKCKDVKSHAHNNIYSGKKSSLPNRSFFKEKLKSLIYNILDINKTYYREERNTFYTEFIKNRNIYYDGYWQNIGYFNDILDIIINEFTFKKELEDKNKKILNLITNPNICSVSIHIRRGDYVNYSTHDCVSIQYYENAVMEIQKLLNNPTYFIFSDDIEWVKYNFSFLKNKNCFFINWNKNKKSYIDMQLMSNCKHNIIANSTFSWWAALLNRNKSKTIITPTYFYVSETIKTKMPMFPTGINVIEIEN